MALYRCSSYAGAALLLVALGRVAEGVGADGVAIEVLPAAWDRADGPGEARLIHTSFAFSFPREPRPPDYSETSSPRPPTDEVRRLSSSRVLTNS